MTHPVLQDMESNLILYLKFESPCTLALIIALNYVRMQYLHLT